MSPERCGSHNAALLPDSATVFNNPAFSALMLPNDYLHMEIESHLRVQATETMFGIFIALEMI